MNGFSVLFCSSEEPHHSFTSLFKDVGHSGWVSDPNQGFPIEILLDPKTYFLLTGIEIVSHEYMIASRVDLYCTTDEIINDDSEWESIGYFCFNINQRSQWRAREFKQISIEKRRLRYLRIIVSDAHPTPQNRFHQVSFVSFKILGRNDIKPRLSTLEDLIEDITKQKNEAVKNENFSAASDFKDQLSNIYENESTLRELFDKKATALLNEEYLEVDSIISQIRAILNKPRSQNDEPIETPEPIIPIKPSEPPKQPEPENPPDNQNETEKNENDDQNDQEDKNNASENEQEDQNNDENDDNFIKAVPDPNSFFLTDFKDQNVVHLPSQDIITPLPDYDVSDYKADDAPPVKPKRSTGKAIRLPQVVNPRTLPDTTEEADPLDDSTRAEAAILIELFGDTPVRTAYSNGWSSKVQGFEKLCTLIKGLKSGKDRAFEGMISLILKRLTDGLKAVYVSVVDNTIDLLENINLPKNNQHVLSNFIHQALPLCLARLGDSNVRINESAFKLTLYMEDKDKWGSNEIINYSLNNTLTCSQNQYHLLSAKLSLLGYIIEKHGIGQKMKLKDICAFVVPCLESRKKEVREESLELLEKKLAPIAGTQLEKYLVGVPINLKKKIMGIQE